MLKLRIRLAFDPRVARVGLAAALLLAAAPELESQITESVSVTTYFPSPSGVYSSLTTTGQTFLARSSGGVAIGTASAGSAKLAVMGPVGINTINPNGALQAQKIAIGGDVSANRRIGLSWHVNSMNGTGFWYGIAREPGSWTYPYPDLSVDFHTGIKVKAHSGYQGVSIWEDWCDSGVDNCSAGGSGFGSEMARFRITAYGGSYVRTRLTLGSSQNAAAALDVAGDGIGVFRQANASCRSVAFGLGGTVNCNAGEYATNQQGILSRMGGSRSSGTMYCCACPSGGCPTLP